MSKNGRDQEYGDMKCVFCTIVSDLRFFTRNDDNL